MQSSDAGDARLDLSFSRRAALSGILAAVLTPTLLAGTAERTASAQAPGTPQVAPIPRTDHTTTSLSQSTVLVAGGNYLGVLSDAQIYSQPDNAWYATGSLNTPRMQHAAAMLGSQVLVCGGVYLGTMSDAELYDPTTGTWSPVAPMNIPRFGHSAASVAGGVLVYGGESLGPITAAEFFDGTSWTLL
jgi:hypothetical protein